MTSLTRIESATLSHLSTPSKIQDFLDDMPFNLEKEGETCMSPRRVLKERKAHCIEGAMLAATALSLHGHPPIIMSLKVRKEDCDHVVALYKHHGYWGAISKTNHAVLRFRDPIYRTLRELALSYFHEYFLISSGKKTLLGYSRPINLRRFGTKWITSENDLWDIAETIFDMHHIPIIPPENKHCIRPASKLERKAACLTP